MNRRGTSPGRDATRRHLLPKEVDIAALPPRLSAADFLKLVGSPASARRPRRNLLFCADGLPSEEAEQRAFAVFMDALVLLWAARGQRLVWTHVPAGGKRKGGEGGKMKAAGYKPGLSDILVFTPPPARLECKGVAIELKRARTGRASANQRQWLNDLDGCGWVAAVCHGADEAIHLITQLGYADIQGPGYSKKGESR